MPSWAFTFAAPAFQAPAAVWAAVVATPTGIAQILFLAFLVLLIGAAVRSATRRGVRF